MRIANRLVDLVIEGMKRRSSGLLVPDDFEVVPVEYVDDDRDGHITGFDCVYKVFTKQSNPGITARIYVNMGRRTSSVIHLQLDRVKDNNPDQTRQLYWGEIHYAPTDEDVSIRGGCLSAARGAGDQVCDVPFLTANGLILTDGAGNGYRI